MKEKQKNIRGILHNAEVKGRNIVKSIQLESSISEPRLDTHQNFLSIISKRTNSKSQTISNRSKNKIILPPIKSNNLNQISIFKTAVKANIKSPLYNVDYIKKNIKNSDFIDKTTLLKINDKHFLKQKENPFWTNAKIKQNTRNVIKVSNHNHNQNSPPTYRNFLTEQVYRDNANSNRNSSLSFEHNNGISLLNNKKSNESTKRRIELTNGDVYSYLNGSFSLVDILNQNEIMSLYYKENMRGALTLINKN
jgi:hypothetical protein